MVHTRHYYRATVHRIPPHRWVNHPYNYEEDVYAFSEHGAKMLIEAYHKNSVGSHMVTAIREISKDEFRGHHKTA